MIPVEVSGQPCPLPGAKPFGKYYLLDRIGVGGMAEVFLAVAFGLQGFQRTLVIKRMLAHLSQDSAFVKMFIDEAKLSGLLSHPNLVQIFEFGQIDESFFIAMEHVQGETLLAVQAKLAEQGRIAPVGASLEIIRQVCLGLNYAHGLQSATGQPIGIVHRDVSPSNLMLSFHGGMKILDFGIARVTEELRETKTQAGTMKGKVAYMSPEQVRMEQTDNRSDIFAVGIVLHEMLTGRRLFKSANEFTGAKKVLEAVVPLPSSLNPEVPASLDPIVMRALERKLEDRYQTAGEMAEDLEKALFEMRASPHEARNLILSLFPKGPSRSGEIQLPFTPSPASGHEGQDGRGTPSRAAARASSSKITRPMPEGPLEIDLGDLAASGPVVASRRRRGRRKWLALGALGGAVVVLVLLAQSPRKGSQQEVTVAPAGAQSAPAAAPSVPAPAPPPEPAPPAPAAKAAVVEISLDSSPQDAQVIREDSGEVVGRTPLTITLPQGQDVVSFRFEKPGFAPTSYKVIPDLAKPVRAELIAEPTVDPKRAIASQQHRPAPPHAHATAAHEARPAAPTESAPAADQARDCLLSIASFPWADLWIDGRDTGQRTPVVHYPVSCGTHKLALKRRDLRVDHAEQIMVAPGHELKQHFDLGDDYAE
jgi:serine/threonine protein kinase